MTDPTFTPTIEQVAEALGEPWAHLAPRMTYVAGQPGRVRLWAVCVECIPFTYKDWRTNTTHYLAGPTRADALRAAWAYVTTQPEPTS